MSASSPAVAPARPRPGSYGLADTGPRFALLMTVVTVSSISMLNTVLAPEPNDTPGDELGCLLAAGMDPDGRNLDNMLITLRHPGALARCMAGVPALQYWKGMIATAVLLAVAAVVHWWQPRLRERWRPTLATASLDPDGSLTAALRELGERAGVTSRVRFRVDPTRTTSGAVVYGRFGQYTVCLHAGLLVRRTTDPDGFRAVVLHELAHIRNRDVVYATASTALWRVFVLLALVPYLWHQGGLLLSGLTGRTDSPFWPGVASAVTYSVLSGLLLVCLVHLARADLLRRRELHADARAVSSGARTSAWAYEDPDEAVTGRVRRVTALLRTHPSWAERQRTLKEPGRLSGVGALAMLLVGVSGTLLVNAVGEVVPLLSTSTGGAWLTTAFLAPVLYVALARSVATAQAVGRAESGLRAGLWLGCGLVLGEVVRGNRGTDWLGPQPQFLLGLLFTAAITAAWSAQCARLTLGLTGRWRRRTAGLLNLGVTAVVLWGGLYWWFVTGKYQSMGVYSQAEEFRELVRRASPGTWQHYTRELSAITETMPTLTTLNALLLQVAAVGLWLLPLVLRASTTASGLRLGRTLAAGAAGGVLCWALLFAVYRLHHGRRPDSWTERAGPYAFVHAWLVMAAVVAACVLTAAVVAALSRRLWMPRALLATIVTQLLAYAGAFVLFSADGCLGPFRVYANRCFWVPSSGRILVPLIAENILTPAVFLSAGAAVCGAGAGWVARRLRRRATPRTEPRSDAPVVTPVPRWRRLAPTGAVLGLALPTLLLAMVAHTGDSGSGPASKVSASGVPGDTVTDLVEAAPRARSARIRAAQAFAWLQHGGLTHVEQLGNSVTDLGRALTAAARQKPGENGKVRLEKKTFHRICGTLAQRADDALGYFPVPDPVIQKKWSTSLAEVSRHGRTCRDAMAPGDDGPYRTDTDRAEAFDTSLKGLLKALDTLVPLLDEIRKAAEPAHRDVQ